MTNITEDVPRDRETDRRPAVIIVSGLPRSGTSLMMQMLDAGGVAVLTDNERAPDIDNPKGYYEFEAVKQLPGNTTWLPEAEGKAVKMVYRLLYDLPVEHSYDVIFMVRNLSEVIRSQDKMLDRLGKSKADVPDDRLESIYRQQIDEVREWLASRPNFRTLYVRYDDVIEHAPAVSRDIARFLGLDLNVAAMEAVPDRALYRNKQ